jgi:flagellar export protein FliJ
MRRKRRFALQAVLDYRRHFEQEAQRAVAQHGCALESHKRQIVDCEEAAKAHMRLVYADETLRLACAHVCEMQVAALDRTAVHHAVAAEEAEAALDAARRYAVEASRGRRAIEILRDRHLAALAAAERRAEEAEIAEVDAMRRRRTTNGMTPMLA